MDFSFSQDNPHGGDNQAIHRYLHNACYHADKFSTLSEME